MLSLLLAQSAMAAPFGNPARSTESAMFGAHLGLGRHSKALEDSSCEGEGCAVISVMETANARIQIQPLDWVGAWLDIERGSNTVEGADYSGSGIGWSAGLSLAPMPVWGGRWSPRPGLSLR